MQLSSQNLELILHMLYALGLSRAHPGTRRAAESVAVNGIYEIQLPCFVVIVFNVSECRIDSKDEELEGIAVLPSGTEDQNMRGVSRSPNSQDSIMLT